MQAASCRRVSFVVNIHLLLKPFDDCQLVIWRTTAHQAELQGTDICMDRVVTSVVNSMHLLQLPDELLLQVLGYLNEDQGQLCRMARVSCRLGV